MAKLKIEHTKHLGRCSARDLQIIQMRYDGASLEDLKEKFGYADKVIVANLFSPSGRLRNPYDEYKAIMHQTFLDEAVNLQKKAIAPAMKILIKNLTSPNGNVANSAAKYIIDREMGSPKQQIEHQGEQPIAIIINPPAEVKREAIEVQGE